MDIKEKYMKENGWQRNEIGGKWRICPFEYENGGRIWIRHLDPSAGAEARVGRI